MKTVLCVPGHDERKVERCREGGADLILFDLEDGVPEDKKERAREIVARAVTRVDHVRVNGGLRYLDDIKAVEGKAAVVWIPKMREPFHNRYLPYVLIVENPTCLTAGLEQALRWKIEKNRKLIGLHGLAFGAADFTAEMNVPDNSPQVAYARQQVALAARALGIPAYDSPFLDLSPSSYRALCDDAYEAFQLGYEWKGVVHPMQIPVVQNVGWEASEALDRHLIRRYEQERGDDAVAIIDGHMVAPPHIRAARKRVNTRAGNEGGSEV